MHASDHKKLGNGYLFEPLADCRLAWEKLYGPECWETAAEEWGWEKAG